MFQQFDNRFTGDAGEDRTPQLRGDNLVAQNEEDVHCTDFLDVLLLNAVQPENLREALGASLFLGQHRSRVVAAGLGKASAAANRTDIAGFNVDVNRIQTGSVVSANRRQDDDKLNHRRVVGAQVGLGGDAEGTDVKRMAFRMGDPIFINLNQLFQRLDTEVHIQGRHCKTGVGIIQTLKVLFRSEQLNMTVGGAVCLQALEGLLAVMENVAGGGGGDVAKGDNLGVVPAMLLVPVHRKHVIGKDFAEAELRIGRFLLRMIGKMYFDFHNPAFP